MTNMTFIRLILQIAVQYDLLIPHIVVKSLYLNAPLDYEIHVDSPEGFESICNGINIESILLEYIETEKNVADMFMKP